MTEEAMKRSTIRIPISIYRAIEVEAAGRDMTINKFLIDCVKSRFCVLCGKKMAAYCESCLYEAHKRGEAQGKKQFRNKQLQIKCGGNEEDI